MKDRVEATTAREFFLATIAAVNTDVSNAVSTSNVVVRERALAHEAQLYTHTKILVAALNGPVMGKCTLQEAAALGY